jgi:NAD-dependent SIR2 family protein deacetylase
MPKRWRACSANAPATPTEATGVDTSAVYGDRLCGLEGRLTATNTTTSLSNCTDSQRDTRGSIETNQSGDVCTGYSVTAQEELELDQKCRRLAGLIARSKHLVAFTGAGISTSVGLPDYRGDGGIRTKGFDTKKSTLASNTVNKRRREDVANELPLNSEDEQDSAAAVVPEFYSLVPSTTHMALRELHRLGYLKHIVSQNVDNLHLKSGIPAQALTEVHGNATQAKCETCEKIYVTDFPLTGLCNDVSCVSTKRSVEQRLRARTRHGNGRLKRNVISFDEPMGDIDRAIDECEEADVALVLGTSLRVEPFTEMAAEYAESLIIVNLLPTIPKLDRRAETTGVRLYQKCDIVMHKTMRFLMGESYEIPAWSGDHPTSVFIPRHEEKNLVNVLAGRLLSS